MRTGLLSFLLLLAFVVCIFSSCGLKPIPCYTTSVRIDSIHVNEPVVFNSACTQSGKEFFWEFNSTYDSTTYKGPVVTRTFDSAGAVEVYLYVINGGKSASRSEVINILP